MEVTLELTDLLKHIDDGYLTVAFLELLDRGNLRTLEAMNKGVTHALSINRSFDDEIVKE